MTELWPKRQAPPEVTAQAFREVMERRGYAVDDLVPLFKGKIEDPRVFFTTIFDRRHGELVIPFKAFYAKESAFLRERAKQRLCACGCNRLVFGRYRWAAPGCRKRIQREAAAA